MTDLPDTPRPEWVARLIETYPPDWRRWCDGPEHGGCACMGCLRVPAPSMVRGDPEYQPFPTPEHRITRQEFEQFTARQAMKETPNE